MLRISYRDSDRRAVLDWGVDENKLPWLSTLRRTLIDHSSETLQETANKISLPWWNFLSCRGEINEILQGYSLKRDVDYDIDPNTQVLLRNSRSNEISFNAALKAEPIDPDTLEAKLASVGFERKLTQKQLRNVGKIASLPSAATFSVPGAGKTTEALATFFFRASPLDHLLIVAPKNAFGAWDEQLSDCIPSLNQTFVRLRGGKDNIERLLEENPRFCLITYQQLPRVRELVAAQLAKHRTFVFLDESHRIKSGTVGPTAQAALSIAHLPTGKMILSGTPMPQSVDDLLPQFTFLYPEIQATPETILNLIKPIYVRTNKAELGLPPLQRRLVRLQMAPVQARLYNLMKSEVARDADAAISVRSRSAFRQLGRSVSRLLQFVSNPALLTSLLQFAHEEMLSAVLAEGDSPKLNYVVRRTRELCQTADRKVLIWSSFVSNVEILAERLSDLGAVFIHGGVDAGDEDDDDTREGKIRLFHDDPSVKVLVANPAAASEGISLHRICHNAIYLDRSFNAAHYLQSEDRIHRFGLKPNQETIVEIVEAANTVDEAVRHRLNYKIAKMAEALDDSSLRIEPEPYDSILSEDVDERTIGTLGVEDAYALIESLREPNA